MNVTIRFAMADDAMEGKANQIPSPNYKRQGAFGITLDTIGIALQRFRSGCEGADAWTGRPKNNFRNKREKAKPMAIALNSFSFFSNQDQLKKAKSA